MGLFFNTYDVQSEYLVHREGPVKKIGFSVQKGGSGKTTTSTNVAFGLARKGYKVVLADCDPQGNASTNYLTEAPEYELSDVLNGNVEVKDALAEIRENFFILPTFSIGGGLRLYGETKVTQEPFIFQDLGEELEKLGFDYLIYDLSPGLGPLERAVMIGSDEVITPILPEYFSLDGVEIFITELEKLRKAMRIKTKYDKVIINNINLSLKIHKETVNDIEKAIKGKLTPYHIPQDVNLKSAQAENISIYEYIARGEKEAGTSRSVQYFETLVEAL